MKFPALPVALRSLLLIICLGQASIVCAVDKQRMLQLGDAAYARKAFDSAISYYEQAVNAEKVPDAVALYKLGNAHYRLKHIGEAVLSYERALLRQPGFPAAARNLSIIQQQVAPKDKEVFFIRWWQTMTAPELSNMWAILAIGIFAGMLGLLAWNKYRRQKPDWQKPQVIVFAIILATVFAVFSFSGAQRYTPDSAAVIMRPDTKFQPSSGSSKGTPMSLPEGLVVKVLDKRKDQIIVALPDGQQGFVQPFDIAIVE
jgi:tetratricopeptide (TPR) repeat protein